MRGSRFSLACLPLLALLLTCACGTKQTPPEPSLPSLTGAADKGDVIWQRFRTRALAATFLSGPFRISGTLRYTDDKNESHRVSSLLWGNGDAANPYPLRLDLLAGVGTVVAKVREDNDALLAYVPDENRAWMLRGQDRTLAAFGVPVPLSLGDLTQILTGLPGALFLSKDENAVSTVPEYVYTSQGASFALVGATLPGELELSEEGVPLTWKEKGDKGWSITFEPAKANPLQPQKLRIEHPGGYSALIVVKDISRVSPPYTTEQTGLELPAGVAVER